MHQPGVTPISFLLLQLFTDSSTNRCVILIYVVDLKRFDLFSQLFVIKCWLIVKYLFCTQHINSNQFPFKRHQSCRFEAIKSITEFSLSKRIFQINQVRSNFSFHNQSLEIHRIISTYVNSSGNRSEYRFYAYPVKSFLIISWLCIVY